MAIAFNRVGDISGVINGTSILDNPTTVQFGPDGRLYVTEQNGTINILTVEIQLGKYVATSVEEVNLVRNIQNHNDDGTLYIPATQSRQVTGLLTSGTAENPVIYVTSSDPRIATEEDKNLDTNSGVLTRLTWTGTEWEAVDLIRGLPRSEENHAPNGMVLSPDGETLYLLVGGNTNNGAPSSFFANTAEYALSASLLEIDLATLDSMPVQTDMSTGLNSGRQYIYDLPTLDDPNIANDGVREDINGMDVTGPWGGNDGLNQAVLPADAPLKIHSTGYRNAYDLVLTDDGRLYTVDNGSNSNLGGDPAIVNGEAVNQIDNGGTPNAEPVFLVEDGNYYGHPNPTRSNQDQSWTVYDDNGDPDATLAVNTVADISDLVPAVLGIPDGYLIDPDKFTDDTSRLLEEGVRIEHPGAESPAILNMGSSSNGLVEYTADNFDGELQGDLLVAQFNGNVARINLSPDGLSATYETIPGLSGLSTPLDVTVGPDGTLWVAEIAGGKIGVFAPTDIIVPGDPDTDDDGILNENDMFLRDATNGGQVFVLPNKTLVWDFDANLDSNLPGPGGYGGGLTGVMSDGVTDFDAYFNEPAEFPLQDIKLDNVKFITAAGGGTTVIENVSTGAASGLSNSGRYLFHTGATVASTVEQFTVQWTTVNPFGELGTNTGPNQQIGGYIGTGDQSNFIKIVAVNNGADGPQIQFGIEENDVLTAYTMDAPGLLDVPTGEEIIFQVYVDRTTGTATPTVTYSLGGGSSNTITGSSISIVGTNVETAIDGEWTITDENGTEKTSGVAFGLYASNVGQTDANTFQAIFTDLQISGAGSSDGTVIARVNAGGPTIAAIDDGPDWSENSEEVPGPYMDSAGSNTTNSTFFNQPDSSVPGYVPTAVLQRERIDTPANPDWSYAFDVPDPGIYEVRLFLATYQSYLENVGDRIFDVSVEGVIPSSFDNIDPIALFGYRSAGMISGVFEVRDGTLNLDFLHDVEGNPVVNGIEILELATFEQTTSTLSIAPPDPQSVQELANDGSTALVFPVTFDTAPISPVTISYQVTVNGTVTEPNGILDLGFDDSFISVAIPNDGVDNGPENIEVTLTGITSGDNGTVLGTATASGIITEDDTTLPGPEAIYRVNVGGAALAAENGDGIDWDADTSTNPNTHLVSISPGASFFSTNSSSAYTPVDTSNLGISDAAPDALFNTERYDSASAPNMIWEFPVGEGTYTVNLYLVEIFNGIDAAGERVFDVAVEGSVPAAFDNIDAYAVAGPGGAFMLSTTVTVSDGSLTLEFLRDIQNPDVSGIEILIGGGMANTAPTVTPIPDVTVDEGATATFAVSAGDVDGDAIALSVAVTDDATGTAVDPADYTFTDNGDGTGSFAWATGDSDDGSYTVAVTADDGTDQTVETLAITVNDLPVGNTAPTVTPIPDVTVDEGATATFAVSAGDVDGDAIALSVAVTDDATGTAVDPADYTFTDNGDGTGSFAWATGDSDDGSYTVAVTADDGTDQTVETFAITVNDLPVGNTAPTVTPIPDVTVDEGATATFAVSAGDVDGDAIALSVAVTDDATGTAVDPADYTFTDNGDGTGSFAWATGDSDDGSYTVSVTADDGTDQTVETFAITVNDLPVGNTAPTVTPIPDIEINEGATATFAINAGDVDGDDITLSVTVIDFNTGTAVDPADYTFTDNGDGTGSFAWATGDSDDGSYTVAVTADDGTDQTTETLAITVNDVEANPSALIQIKPNQGNFDTSVYSDNSIQIHNTGNVAITSVTLDLSTAILPDMVFDPDGTAGDPVGRGVRVSATSSDVGFAVPTDPDLDPFSGFQNGVDSADGYTTVSLSFTDFNQGASFLFGADVDPSSIKGVNFQTDIGSVSGLELIGSTITLSFENGTFLTSRLFEDGSNGGSKATLSPTISADAPVLSASGVSAPDTVTNPNQILRIEGVSGQQVVLLQIDAGLGSPEPGFSFHDLDLFEANTALARQTYSATIGTGGFIEVPVTLLATDGTGRLAEGGLNHFVAAFVTPDGEYGPASDALIIEYETSPTNTAPTVTPIPDVTVDEGATATFAVSAGDVDGDAIALSVAVTDDATGLDVDPADYTFTDNGDGTGSFAWATDDTDDGSYTVSVTADDGTDQTVETLAITVNDLPVGNTAPTVTPIPDVTVDEGATATFAVSAGDVDGDAIALSVAVTDDATGTAVDPADYTFTDNGDGTGSFAWATEDTDDGSYTVSVTADDGTDQTVETLAITVNDLPVGNTAPTVTPIPDVTVDEGATATFAVSAGDVDGDAIALSVAVTDDATGTAVDPADYTFTDNGDGTGSFAWATEDTDDGSYTVSVTADDGTDQTVETLAITVNDLPVGNTAPTVTPIPDVTVDEGATATFAVSAGDVDGDAIALSVAVTDDATGLDVDPADYTFTDNGDGTGSFAWATDDTDDGSYTVSVTADDGTDQTVETLAITVNDLPVGNTNTLTVRAGGTGTVSAPPVFEVFADGVSLGTSAITDPVEGSFNRNDDSLYQDYTFSFGGASPDSVEIVYANDGATGGVNRNLFLDWIDLNGTTFETEEDGFFQTANPNLQGNLGGVRETAYVNGTFVFDDLPDTGGGGTNTAPTVTPIPDVTVDEGATATFAVSAGDVDGDAIALSVAVTDDATGLDVDPADYTFTDNGDGTGSFAWATDDTDDGSYTVSVTADDGTDQTVETLAITVNDLPVGNTAPTVTPIPDVTVDEGATATFAVSAGDVDGDAIALSVAVTDDATGLDVDPADYTFTDNGDGTGSFAWATDDTDDGSYTVSVTADDGTDQTVETLAITVNDLPVGNTAPTVTPIPDVTVDEGATATFAVSAGDVDGDAIALSVAVTDDATGTAVDPADYTFTDNGDGTGSFAWATDDTDDGSYTVSVTADDGTDQTVETLAITVNDLPVGNTAPTVTPIPDVTVDEGATATFAVSAGDVDGDAIALSVAVTDDATGTAVDPADYTFTDNGDGTGSFAWATDDTDDGSYTVSVTADDGTDQTVETLAITVNDLPVGNTNTLTVRAGGTGTVSAPPVFEVFADGVSLGTSAITDPVEGSFNRNDDSLYQDYTFSFGGASPDSVEIVYANDGATGGVNRNLFLDWIDLNGTTFETEEDGFFQTANPNLQGNLGGVRETAYVNGTFVFDDLPDTGGGGTNTAPTVTPIPDVTVDEGATATFAVSAGDVDGDAIALSVAVTDDATGLDVDPADYTFTDNGDGTGSFAWATDDTDDGSYTVSVTADDGTDQTVETLAITVNDLPVGNTAPTVTPIPDVTVDEGATATFAVSAGDVDGDAIALSVAVTDDATGLDVDPADYTFTDNGDGTGSFAWATDDTDDGSYTVSVTADDGTDQTVETLAITVNDLPVGNTAPTVTPIPDVTVDEGATATFAVSAGDVDGDAIALSVAVTDDATGTAVDPADYTFTDNGDGTGSFAWATEDTDDGSYTVSVTADDGTDQTVETLAITVNDLPVGNTAPTVTPIPDVTVDEGATATFAVSAGDVDGDAIALSVAVTDDATGLDVDPADYTFTDNGDGTGSFAWATDDTDDGSYTVSVTADDGTDQTVETLAITVNDLPVGNTAPTVTPIPDVTVDEGATATFAVSAGDVDGDAIALSVAVTDDATGLDVDPADYTFTDNGDGTGSFAWATDDTDDGSYTVSVTADDGTDQTVETLAITVNDLPVGNTAPTVTPIPDVTVDEGATATFAVSAGDVDGDAIALSVAVTDDATGTAVDPADYTFTDNGDGTGSFAWATDDTDDGSYTVSVTADDGTDQTVETLAITVNDLPVGNTNTLTVRAGGTGTVSAPPVFEVFADGVSLGTSAITDPVEGSFNKNDDSLYQDYTFSFGGASPDSVEIVYANDGATGGVNRNLFLDWIDLNGTTFETEEDGFFQTANPNLQGNLGGVRETAYVNGTFVFDDLPDTGGGGGDPDPDPDPGDGYYQIVGSGNSARFKVQFEDANGPGGTNPGGLWNFHDSADDSGHQSGFQGSGYYVWGDEESEALNIPLETGFLEYTIYIPEGEAGDYALRLRASRDPGGASDAQNDVWLKIDDDAEALQVNQANTVSNSGFVKVFGGGTGSWGNAVSLDGVPDPNFKAVFSLDEGFHTLTFAGRSQGFHLDFWDLYQGGTPATGSSNSPFVEAETGNSSSATAQSTEFLVLDDTPDLLF